MILKNCYYTDLKMFSGRVLNFVDPHGKCLSLLPLLRYTHRAQRSMCSGRPMPFVFMCVWHIDTFSIFPVVFCSVAPLSCDRASRSSRKYGCVRLSILSERVCLSRGPCYFVRCSLAGCYLCLCCCECRDILCTLLLAPCENSYWMDFVIKV